MASRSALCIAVRMRSRSRGGLVGSPGCRASVREFLHYHLAALIKLAEECLTLPYPKWNLLKTHRRSCPMMAVSQKASCARSERAEHYHHTPLYRRGRTQINPAS